MTLPGTGSTALPFLNNLYQQISHRSSWFLTQIITANGEIIDFSYVDNKYIKNLRLMEMGNNLGLVDNRYLDLLRHKYIGIQEGIKFLYSNTIRPENINGLLSKNNSSPVAQNEFLANLLRRNEVTIKELFSLETFKDNNFVNEIRNDDEVLNQIEIEIKYEGYIKRQNEQVEQFNRTEDLKIPVDFNYDRIKSISSEALDKLKKIKPLSIGQAGRIAGVRPSDISAVLIYMRG